ncbi:MAG TPA: hypothetical protein VGT98_04685 [Candidatus Elarobacter sp.]|nr:hypothetical protein [Candidatus Elarobacter sp.]HEV2740744.1 hypothetical protein [Candidatus Elarobacter sp.]
MEREELDGPGSAGEQVVLARAAQIVLDATEVDWSRDPLTDYEAEIRRTWLTQQMERGTYGRIEIAELTFGMRDMGADLREALDGIFMLAEIRAARSQSESLRSARDAVNRRRPGP